MGGGGRPDTSAADRSYELQKENLKFQRQQLAEIKAKEKGIEAAKQEKLDELIKRKRTGRRATILTDFESLGLPAISRKSLYA